MVGAVADREASPAVVPSGLAIAQIAYQVLVAIVPVSRAFAAPLVPRLIVPDKAVVLKLVPSVVTMKSAATVTVVFDAPLIDKFLNTAGGANADVSTAPPNERPDPIVISSTPPPIVPPDV